MTKRKTRKVKREIKKRVLNILTFVSVILSVSFILNSNNFKDIKGAIIGEDNVDRLGEYKEAFSEDVNQNMNYQYLELINKNNNIDLNYEPNDLVIPSIRFGNIGNMMVQYVRRDVAVALEKLFKAAKNGGINLVAISGYRSYDYQKNIYDNEVNNVGKIQANRYVAKPGQSEHQTGLAMDLLSDEYMNLDEGFENTESFRWLEENMSKFGFILRYPKGKEDITGYGYEPWHIRYVGVEDAKKIMDEGLTLEEYLSR